LHLPLGSWSIWGDKWTKIATPKSEIAMHIVIYRLSPPHLCNPHFQLTSSSSCWCILDQLNDVHAMTATASRSFNYYSPRLLVSPFVRLFKNSRTTKIQQRISRKRSARDADANVQCDRVAFGLKYHSRKCTNISRTVKYTSENLFFKIIII